MNLRRAPDLREIDHVSSLSEVIWAVGGGQQSNSLLALLGYGQLGLGAPIVGTGAQKLAERSTAKNADKLRAMVASGGKMEVPAITNKTKDLIADMIRRGGRAAAPHIPMP